MNKIVLQKAALKDLKEIADLEKKADSRTYSAIVKDSELRAFIKNESVFLIKRKSVILGSIAYKILKKKVAHIDGLIVSPKFRGRGIARQAAVIILKRLSKYPRIELLVHPHNNPAICLYLSLGFIVESWKDDYFGDGEPRLMLTKSQ